MGGPQSAQGGDLRCETKKSRNRSNYFHRIFCVNRGVGIFAGHVSMKNGFWRSRAHISLAKYFFKARP
jgi:hypothetical protein